MNTLNELLNETALRLGKVKPISDAALGRELGCSSSVLHNWRNGKGQPDTYAVWRMAEVLAMDPRAILAVIEGERAKDNERKEYWDTQVRRFRSTTSVLLAAFALMLATALLPQGEAKAAEKQYAYLAQKQASTAMFIMSSWIRTLKRFCRLLGAFLWRESAFA